MNEEKYTRNSAKKSTRKKKVNPDIHAGKSHGKKLKNDSSAARSYRDKIRYGKKDNSLSVSEAKELRSMKKQGRRRIYKNQAVAATVRKTTIKNEDDNSGTDSLNAGLAAVEAGIGKVREHGQARKYSSKIHNRSDHLDAVQGAKGAKEAGEAGESTMSATVKKTRKKLMQREFAEAAAKKQAKEAANGAGKISKKLTDQAEDLMGRLAEMLKEFCEDHPIGMIIAVAILIVVLVLSGALTSCSALGSGINSGTVATSFTAEDDDIRQVEADYVALETVLQNKVDSIETDHPGYDEYNYSLSEISHNPFELAALLTVLYEDYTPSEVQSKLQTIRFRSLGEDFTEENLKKVIAGEKEPPKRNEKVPERKESKPEKRKFDLVVDIQEKMAQGKNGGYVWWAKKYNVKQFAESILFLQQHDIHDKKTLDALVDGSSAKYHELMKTIKDAEEKMAANKVIKTHIINYAKTRETYIAYRKSGYSKKFYEAHRDEITLHKAAKEAFAKLPDGKIPKVKDLNEEFVRLLSEKKAAYSEYKKIKKEMRDYQIAKQNVESFYAAQQSWDIEEDMKKKRQQER